MHTTAIFHFFRASKKKMAAPVIIKRVEMTIVNVKVLMGGFASLLYPGFGTFH